MFKLQHLTEKYEKLRVIDIKTNRGKAGLIASHGEILVTIDADAYLDKEALNYLVYHLLPLKTGNKLEP
ncbi:glycosyltransferase [Peribacillus kribbensis]|uniref:glycosyltransferase n=1 Tax=Peribacillus kribbensis TaxID=356658 RepID=UPI0003FB241D|nr:hypothetical protein [Peribacillus kribbensis]